MPRAALPLALVVLLLAPAWPATADEVLPPYAPRPSILIDGDDAFLLPGSGVRSGSGTAEDPYIIERWTLLPDARYGVRIANTTKHVVLRDLVTEPATRGPELSSVGPCLADALACPEASFVRLESVSNVTVERLALPVAMIMVGVYWSERVQIRDLAVGLPGDLVWEGMPGLVVAETRHVTLDRIVSDSYRGAWLVDVEDVLVVDSLFRGGTLAFARSGNATIVGNRFEAGGIDVSATARGLVIIDNEFVSSPEEWTWAPTAIRYANRGHLGEFRDGVSICGNHVRGYHRGIHVQGAWQLLVVGNVVESSDEGGIETTAWIGYTRHEVAGNRVNGSAHWGVRVPMAQAVVHNNSIFGNGASWISGDARFNWWGDASGPSGTGPGTGEKLRFTSRFDPWLLEPAPASAAPPCERMYADEFLDRPVRRTQVFSFEGNVAPLVFQRHIGLTTTELKATYLTTLGDDGDFGALYGFLRDGEARLLVAGTGYGTIGASVYAGVGDVKAGTPTAPPDVVGRILTFTNSLYDRPIFVAAGATHGIARTLVEFTSTSIEAPELAFRFMRTGGVVTERDLAPPLEARVRAGGGLGAAVAERAEVNVVAAHRLVSYSIYRGAPLIHDEHAFTLTRPAGSVEDAHGAIVQDGAPGRYAFALEQRTLGTGGGFVAVHADVDPTPPPGWS